MSGSNIVPSFQGGQPGVYGTLGSPSSAVVPGGRLSAVGWTDANANLWLFSGNGDDSATVLGYLNDLFQFNPATAQWTWMKGSNTINQTGSYGTRGVPAAGNVPGARESAAAWTDATGNFWLFGGFGYDSLNSCCYLNDLWYFKPLPDRKPQTITFPNPGTQHYGVTPFALNATADSGLPVSYSVLSGPATVSGSTLTITGTGSVTVQASQPGDAAFLPAVPVSVTFAVNGPLLIVVADNQAVAFGAPIPPLTGTLTGVLPGDGITATFTTTATTGSPVGDYPITPHLQDPKNRLSNYSIASTDGDLVIYGTTLPLPLWLSPSIAAQGDGNFILTVNGANFAPNSVVLWNGSERATVFIDSTQLTATILATDLANAETALVSVSNPAPVAATSGALPFLVASAHPVAVIDEVSVSDIGDGSGNRALTLAGTGFGPLSIARWNNTSIVTNNLSSVTAAASITPTQYAARPATVDVVNPSGDSNIFHLP